ncbi:hypothetical protein ACOME3_005261 [Neoechinorhynchus agilis]
MTNPPVQPSLNCLTLTEQTSGSTLDARLFLGVIVLSGNLQKGGVEATRFLFRLAVRFAETAIHATETATTWIFGKKAPCEMMVDLQSFNIVMPIDSKQASYVNYTPWSPIGLCNSPYETLLMNIIYLACSTNPSIKTVDEQRVPKYTKRRNRRRTESLPTDSKADDEREDPNTK